MAAHCHVHVYSTREDGPDTSQPPTAPRKATHGRISWAGKMHAPDFCCRGTSATTNITPAAHIPSRKPISHGATKAMCGTRSMPGGRQVYCSAYLRCCSPPRVPICILKHQQTPQQLKLHWVIVKFAHERRVFKPLHMWPNTLCMNTPQ